MSDIHKRKTIRTRPPPPAAAMMTMVSRVSPKRNVGLSVAIVMSGVGVVTVCGCVCKCLLLCPCTNKQTNRMIDRRSLYVCLGLKFCRSCQLITVVYTTY